jgi:hypothetical protein
MLYANIVSILITLVSAQTIKLLLTTRLSLNGYSYEWIISTLGIIIGYITSEYYTPTIINKIESKFKKEHIELITDMSSILIILLIHQLLRTILLSNITFNLSWAHDTYIVVSIIMIYTVLIKPLIPEQYELINNILRRTIIFTTANTFSGIELSSKPIEYGSTITGVAVGELVNTQLSVEGTALMS